MSLSARKFLQKAWLAFFLLALWLANIQDLSAQVRAGSAYLKILPGTRQQSLANSMTGALDETYAFYANPGAVGLLREWQWSASYTNWIADIFNLSLIYGTKFRLHTPLSQHLILALGLNYQGVDEFDATRGAQPPASANDLLFSASMGLPISALPKKIGDLSLGANFKYLRSELDQFNASTPVFDIGAIYRTPRWRFPFLFEHWIVSTGVALNQLGSSLNFESHETPLPRTFRGGLALNLGSHDGIQVQLAADYHNIRDEVDQFSLGAELSNFLNLILPPPLDGRLGRILALRGGYNFNSERNTGLVEKWAFGLSVRLDDYMNFGRNSERQIFPSRNAAFRFDYGNIDSDIYDNIDMTSMTYTPIGPEPFAFVESDYQSLATDQPAEQSFKINESVSLAWHTTRDPDLYDDVNYLLLLSKDVHEPLVRFIEQAEKNEINAELLRDYDVTTDKGDSIQIKFVELAVDTLSRVNDSDNNSDLRTRQDSVSYVHANARTMQYTLRPENTVAGDYYWSVLAYDRNRHFRVIETAGSHIARFHVKENPDLTINIINIRKEQSRFFADVAFSNSVETVDDSFSVKIKMLNSEEYANLDFEPVEGIRDLAGPPIIDESVKASSILQPERFHADTTFWFPRFPMDSTYIVERVPWDETRPYMAAVVDIERKISEKDEFNNLAIDTLLWYDLELTKTAEVAPLKPQVQFNLNDSTLTDPSKKYLANLGRALKTGELAEAFIKLEGHTDTQGFIGRTREQSIERNQKLSEGRVRSVKKYLVKNFKIDSLRICEVGYGQTRPLPLPAGMPVSEKHFLNRRVEIYLLKQEVDCSPDSVDRNLMIDAVFQGTTFKYNLKVVNKGPNIAYHARIWDALPKFVTPVKIDIDTAKVKTDVARTGSDSLFWQIPQLAVGDSAEIIITIRVDSIPSAVKVHRITNRSQVLSDIDLHSANDTSSSTGVYALPNTPPEAINVIIEGKADIGQILQGSYDYFDADGDAEGASKFRWLRDGVAIPSANRRSYRVMSTDVNKKIAFEVTPVARDGVSPGNVAVSPNVEVAVTQSVNSPPKATDVTIAGVFDVGEVLSGGYVYSDADGDREGNSKFRWLRDNEVIPGATHIRYKLTEADRGHVIKFEVTPRARNGASPGMARQSDGVTIKTQQLASFARGSTILEF